MNGRVDFGDSGGEGKEGNMLGMGVWIGNMRLRWVGGFGTGSGLDLLD